MSEPVAGEVGRPELAPGAAMPHAIPGDQLRNHVDPDIATPGQLGLLHPVEVAAAGVEQRPDLKLLETSVAPFLLITTGSVGWLGATVLGGWLITHHGFASLGIFSAVAALGGAALAAGTWRPGRGPGAA